MYIGYVYVVCKEQNITEITVNMDKCANFTLHSVHDYDELVNHKYKTNQDIGDITKGIKMKRNKE